jgi:signal transduction histidine kinase
LTQPNTFSPTDGAFSSETSVGSDQFMTTAVHDLRNPVAVIRASAQMATRSLARGDEAAALNRLKVIVAQADRVTRLMEMLQDSAYIDCGRLPLRLERLDLAELAHTAVDRARQLDPEAERTVRIDIEPGLVGDWDRVRLGRAIESLVENALIYGDPEQPITIRAVRTDDVVSLMVHAGGAGPQPEEFGRLFEMFFRGHAAGEAGQPGSGLGLYTSRGIARAHSGDVRHAPHVAADAFEMTLPLAQAA